MIETTIDQAQEIIKEYPFVILMRTSKFCGPCQGYKPIFLQLASEFNSIVFLVVNIHGSKDEPNYDLDTGNQNLKGQGLPWFIFYRKGIVIHEFWGADLGVPKSKLEIVNTIWTEYYALDSEYVHQLQVKLKK